MKKYHYTIEGENDTLSSSQFIPNFLGYNSPKEAYESAQKAVENDKPYGEYKIVITDEYGNIIPIVK